MSKAPDNYYRPRSIWFNPMEAEKGYARCIQFDEPSSLMLEWGVEYVPAPVEATDEKCDAIIRLFFEHTFLHMSDHAIDQCRTKIREILQKGV